MEYNILKTKLLTAPITYGKWFIIKHNHLIQIPAIIKSCLMFSHQDQQQQKISNDHKLLSVLFEHWTLSLRTDQQISIINKIMSNNQCLQSLILTLVLRYKPIFGLMENYIILSKS